MVARATRVDPHAGAYEQQEALVFHPDDPLFARFRLRVETEQGTLARRREGRTQSTLPLWLREKLAEREREPGIVPLQSTALGLRYVRLRPGPELALARPELEQPQTELLEVPSAAERRLRAQVGELVATQAVEDEGALRGPRGQGLYHRYNAVLKRALGGKGRGAMALAELEAAVGWLERNRLSEHLHLLDGDARYSWTARQRSEWRPPVGRVTHGASPARKTKDNHNGT